MTTFLEETLFHIQKTNSNLSSATFVLPSKRAGGFLKNYLRKSATVPQFLPKIISIEDLIQELSGLEIIDTTELLFRSYDVYSKTDTFKNKDTFDAYSGWATTLLNDFNEVDRYLVDTKKFFDYLGSIKTLERWNITSTKIIESYVAFWNNLPAFYENLKNDLLQDRIAYQGLVYREAVAALEHYLQAHTNTSHYFVGFNALNTSEQQIIQAFLENGSAEIFWDAEKVFVEDPAHSASLFFRKFQKQWKYFQHKSPQYITDNFATPKQINTVSCQNNIAQIKYVGHLLRSFSEEKLNNTAIVLADEILLLPLLHSLPKNVLRANVTMGASVKNFPVTVFFESWLTVHTKNSVRFYYKDILQILGHPLASSLVASQNIITAISKGNRSHYNQDQLLALSPKKDHSTMALLFSDLDDSPLKTLTVCQKLLQQLKNISQKQTIENVVLYKLHGIFQRLESLNKKFAHLSTLKGLQELFLELTAATTIDFKGDAYDGLQIMGVLETRVLDFENIIMLSVNEGVLPAGKSNASFITYDLKKEFDLPLFTEKDAIYTYHFYHILHRAKEVTLCYTDFTEGLNTGEKSRFLLQLEIEKQPQHTISKFQTAPTITVASQAQKTIEKTEAVLMRLQEIAANGFSPSALTSYIRNPIDFYYQKVLKIQEEDAVEETVAYNTLGTIVHDTLQQLYEPHIGRLLNATVLKEMKTNVAAEITKQFSKSFAQGDISTGKNLIIFEVTKRYVENAIALDLSEINKGNTIKLLHIESNLALQLSIPELDFPVKIHGQVDRIDIFNGELRIIDYKTGSVHIRDLEVIDWDALKNDYTYSKAFQVLTYALMMQKKHPFKTAQGGVISFKNMKGGFLKFATKESARGKKDQTITSNTLQLFTEQLSLLILEICNPDIPFTEKEIV